MEENNMAANADAVIDAAPEGVASPEPQAEPQAEPQVDQEQKITKIVSERIKKEQERISAEAEARANQAWQQRADTLISQLYGESGISTIEQAEAALAQRRLEEEAAKQQVPVELYQRLTQAERDNLETKARLSEYERREALTKEAETLSADPKWGSFFKANEAEIRRIADRVKCDLDTAKLLVYDRVGPQTVDEEAIAQKAIQDFLDKKRNIKPTEGSGAAPITVQAAPKTFEEARKNAFAQLRASREQT